jgi:hypothetical protein
MDLQVGAALLDHLRSDDAHWASRITQGPTLQSS